MQLGDTRSSLLAEGRHQAVIGEQQLFGQWLGYIRKNEIYSLPDLTPLINHEGRKSLDVETALGVGFFASDSLHADWGNTSHQRPPARMAFETHTMLRVGREDSRRKVFFGSLSQEWFDGSRETIQVAVKPFPQDERGTGLHEVSMYQHLAQRGFPTLDVLGVLSVPVKKEQETSLYMISRFHPGIITMDNLPWHDMSAEDAWENIGRYAITSLISLHAAPTPEEGEADLLLHGDTYLRNFAFNDVGDPVIVDCEEMVSASRLVHPSFPRGFLVKLLGHEFRELVTSANEAVLKGRDLTDTDKFEENYKHIYLPYHERVAKSDSPYKAALLLAWDEVVDQHAKQASGNW